MVIDAHTHIFPDSFREERAELCRREPLFAEMYQDPRARMVSASQLIAEMDGAGISHAVVCGFAWGSADLCAEHNDALLNAAAISAGRLLPFPSLPLRDRAAAAREAERCRAGGARGFGELRPAAQGLNLETADDAALLAALAGSLPLLIHASEPVGHGYPGKGGQPLGALYAFLLQHPETAVIAAHLGGGLPFYADMPEVAAALDQVWFDTAAWPYLYRPTVFSRIIDLVGVERLLFGSDFPLRPPGRDLELLAQAGLSAVQLNAITGGNAATLFSLVD